MNSHTKKIRIQELNKSIEKRYVQEKKQKVNLVNEGMWDRLVANTAGFFNRFKTFGQNVGAIFGGGSMMNPALEAAYARVRQRAGTMQKELIELESDLQLLYDTANKDKVKNRVDKLGGTRKGKVIEDRMKLLDSAVLGYLQAINTMKGANEGFLEKVKSA